VQPDAPTDVIQGAYRTLMQKLQMHPDLGGDDRNAALINAAWHVLRDPERRTEYDCQLLSDYDIQVLASSGKPLCHPAHNGSANRRNYYRVLGVQADAPQALIDSAYKVLSGADAEDGALLREAYRVLGSPARRQQYDVSHTTEPVVAEAAYRPLIRNFCLFCKTPYDQYPGCLPTGMCCECGSPLREHEAQVDQADRYYERARFSAWVELHEYWPGQALDGTLEELTPVGLCISMRSGLEPGQIVRVSNATFTAVARIVHCAQSGPDFRFGMQLLTVSFSVEGVLVDIKT
ncbi:MAG: DnaJ domain-containing protein, partial [Gammaproteobacteria bacterium]|nr:DnaJ domain-containing protein [Gammaproteobacteria bacterium]